MPDRVPADTAHRAGGFAIAVAAGINPSISIIGENSLAYWTQLSRQKEEDSLRAHKAEEQLSARHEISQSRSANWVGTVVGNRKAKLLANQKRIAETEERRMRIDAEEAQLREELSRQKLSQSNKALWDRDQRMLALKTELLSKHVQSERDEQLKLSARKKAETMEREQFFHEQALESARRAQNQEDQKMQTAKTRAAEATFACQQQLAEQKSARIQARISEENEGRIIRMRAEAAAAEERLQQQERLKEARETALFNLKLHEASTTKPGDPVVVAEDRDYLETKSEHVAVIEARSKEKAAVMERVREAAALSLVKTPRKLYEPENFPRNINTDFHEREEIRRKAQERGMTEYIEALKQQTQKSPRNVNSMRNNAQSSNDNLASPTREASVRRLIEALRQEEIEEKISERERARKVDQIRLLQAREKATRDALERAQQLSEDRKMIQAQRDEDSNVADFVMQHATEAGLSPLAQRRILKAVGEPISPLWNRN